MFYLNWLSYVTFLFSHGTFPSIFKTIKAIPVYKKESKVQCSNYSSISLLSNIDKTFERLEYNQFHFFLELCSFIYGLQSGFQQKYSTSHALIDWIDKIREQLDSGNFHCDLFDVFLHSRSWHSYPKIESLWH